MMSDHRVGRPSLRRTRGLGSRARTRPWIAGLSLALVAFIGSSVAGIGAGDSERTSRPLNLSGLVDASPYITVAWPVVAEDGTEAMLAHLDPQRTDGLTSALATVSGHSGRWSLTAADNTGLIGSITGDPNGLPTSVSIAGGQSAEFRYGSGDDPFVDVRLLLNGVESQGWTRIELAPAREARLAEMLRESSAASRADAEQAALGPAGRAFAWLSATLPVAAAESLSPYRFDLEIPIAIRLEPHLDPVSIEGYDCVGPFSCELSAHDGELHGVIRESLTVPVTLDVDTLRQLVCRVEGGRDPAATASEVTQATGDAVAILEDGVAKASGLFETGLTGMINAASRIAGVLDLFGALNSFFSAPCQERAAAYLGMQDYISRWEETERSIQVCAEADIGVATDALEREGNRVQGCGATVLRTPLGLEFYRPPEAGLFEGRLPTGPDPNLPPRSLLDSFRNWQSASLPDDKLRATVRVPMDYCLISGPAVDEGRSAGGFRPCIEGEARHGVWRLVEVRTPDPGADAGLYKDWGASSGHIWLLEEGARPNQDPWTEMRFDIHFNPPRAILNPNQEHKFVVDAFGKVTDPASRGRGGFAQAYLTLNERSAELIAVVGVSCVYPGTEQEYCEKTDAQVGEQFVAMPAIFLDDFESPPRQVAIGVSLHPCPPCSVSYVYEAQQMR